MDRFSFFSEPFNIFSDPFFSFPTVKLGAQQNENSSLWRPRLRFEPSKSVPAVIPTISGTVNHERRLGRLQNTSYSGQANAKIKTSRVSGRMPKRDPEIVPTTTSLGNVASYELRFARPKTKLKKALKVAHKLSSNDIRDDVSHDDEGKFEVPQLSEQKTPSNCAKEKHPRQITGKTGNSKRNADPDLTALIENDIVLSNLSTKWEDIVGLDDAKQVFRETFLLPTLMPQLFKGVLRPWRGILLFGPPGTGKTLLARAVASQTASTFFNILPSTLTSKHYGESEKLVRALFTMARARAPSVIFLDEIDAFCGREREHEATRRVRCEMLAHMDGLVTDDEKDKSVVILAATNHPWDLDEAFKRRFEKRIYIPLPDKPARKQMIELYSTGLAREQSVDWSSVAKELIGYSGSDIKSLCQEAILNAARELMESTPPEKLCSLELDRIVLSSEHFVRAKAKCKSSVNTETIQRFKSWNKVYGSG